MAYNPEWKNIPNNIEGIKYCLPLAEEKLRELKGYNSKIYAERILFLEKNIERAKATLAKAGVTDLTFNPQHHEEWRKKRYPQGTKYDAAQALVNRLQNK